MSLVDLLIRVVAVLIIVIATTYCVKVYFCNKNNSRGRPTVPILVDEEDEDPGSEE